MKNSLPLGDIEVYNSVGGAAFFERLLQEWRDVGARVHLIQALDESGYRRKRGALGSMWLRWQMYPGYALACWRSARSGRNTNPVRVVTTNPFFAPALVARSTRGSGATINLLYDLFPEALIQSGQIAPGSATARWCGAVTRHALEHCEATVFLGDRLRAYAEKNYCQARRAVVIPVGADGGPFRSAPPALLPANVRPQVLYSGLMGRMHEVDTIGHALVQSSATEIGWVFHASGAGYSRLKTMHGITAGVTWGDGLPASDWERAMKQAQVALVTIARGAERVVMPSKTYSALVAGQAVLAVCPQESDLADLVKKHNCGWVVEPGDTDGLAAALRIISGQPGVLLEKRRRAFAAGHELYESTIVAKQWLCLFEELRTDAGENGRKGACL